MGIGISSAEVWASRLKQNLFRRLQCLERLIFEISVLGYCFYSVDPPNGRKCCRNWRAAVLSEVWTRSYELAKFQSLDQQAPNLELHSYKSSKLLLICSPVQTKQYSWCTILGTRRGGTCGCEDFVTLGSILKAKAWQSIIKAKHNNGTLVGLLRPEAP